MTSSLTLLCVLVGQILQKYQKSYLTDTILQKNQTYGQLTIEKALQIIGDMVPTYETEYTLLSCLALFILSLLFLQTRKNEEEESLGQNFKSQRLADPIEQVENMRNYQIQRAVQIIKDYKFKSAMNVQLELLTLASVSSITCTILVIPYAILFLILCLIMAFNKSQKALLSASRRINLVLVSLLIVDLTVKYFMKGGNFAQEAKEQRLFNQVVGLLSSQPTYYEFYIKIFLFLIECSKIQYSHDYQKTLDSIKVIHGEKPELKRLFKKRASFTYRIFKPISIFVFCSIALIFCLLHPAIIFLTLLPLIIYGYFMEQQEFCGVSRALMVILSLFLLAQNTFHIVFLLLPNGQFKEDYITYFERILGVQRNAQILNGILPFYLDYFMLMLMAFFGHYVQKKQKQVSQPSRQSSRIAYMAKNGYDEDMLTIPDDVSEAKSKISFKTNTFYQNYGTSSEMSYMQSQKLKYGDNPIAILEDKKEEDQEDELFSQSTQNKKTNRLGRTQTYMNRERPEGIDVNRDETFRGTLRRVLFKVYLKLVYFFDRLLDFLIIHSAKFALIAIFMISVGKPNLFNAGLFLIFLFMTIASYRNVQKYWVATIIYTSMIIICLYVIDVFRPEEVLKLEDSTLTVIGLALSKSSEFLLIKHLPYLALLAILIIAHYILHSQRYEDFLSMYNMFEMREELRDEDEKPLLNNRQKETQIGLSDFLTKLIIKYSLYILVIALFVECVILPVSVLNFVLLILMSSIVMKYLKSESSIQLYQRLRNTLIALKWISLIFIFLKYTFQFEDYAYNLAQQSNMAKGQNSQYYEHLPLIEKLFGIENTNVAVKLFSLALVMSISNLQLKYLEYRYLADILREEDSEWDRLKFMDVKSVQSRFKLYFHHFKVYLYFLSYYILLPMPIFFMIKYSINYISAIGFLIFTASIILMYQQSSEFWRYVHIRIGSFASISILITYGLQFIFLNIDIKKEFVEWLGVEKQDEKVSVVYGQLIPLFEILIICALQKESKKTESLFRLTSPLSQENQDSDKEDKSGDDSNESSFEKQQQEKEKREIEEALRIFEAPIRNCINIRDNYLKIFFFTYGYIIMIFISLVVVLYKLNLTSIFYLTTIMVILKQRYYPLRFQFNLEQNDKKKNVSLITRVYLVVISFTMIAQYFMMIGPAYKFDYTSWKKRVTSKLCIIKSKECYNEWQEWLSISNLPDSYILMDFWILLSAYVVFFYLNDQITLSPQQILKWPKIYDENDFLSHRQLNKFNTMVQYIIFNGFPYIMISYLMIFAATYHESGMSDMLSAGYLFIAMYYITNFRKLYTKNHQMLRFIRGYNFFMMFTVILFQAPVFLCPSIDSLKNGLHFIPRNKCEASGNINQEEFTDLNSYFGMYIVFTQSLGLVKINKIQYDLILMIILTEIQNHLFHHPYFQIYVTEHMKVEKETDGKLRAFIFVEQTHLSKLWSYKAIKQEIKILHQRLIRINNTIRNKEYSKHLILEGEDLDDMNENQLLLNDGRSSENDIILQTALSKTLGQQLKTISEDKSAVDQESLKTVVDEIVDEYQSHIEDLLLILLSQPDTPVIPLKYFIESFRNHLLVNQELVEAIQVQGESETVKNMIEKELLSILKVIQRQIHQKHRIDLFYKEGVGLNFAIQKGSYQYLDQSDYSFYKHLILSEKQSQNSQDFEKFELLESYEEIIMIQDQFKEVESKSSTFFLRFNFYLRSYLWRTFINKQLFYSLTQKSTQQISLYKMPILRLLSNCILSQSLNISYLVLFINFILSPNIISLLPALSALLYALLDFPVASIKYWKVLTGYMLIALALKFIYQLPIFCGSPAFSLYSSQGCSVQPVIPEVLLGRIDYIIGIHKFAGPYAFPKDQGILSGIIGDLLVLITLLILKNYLIKIGMWHYVKTKNNIYQSPAFKCKVDELTDFERLNLIKRENFEIYEYDQQSFLGKVQIKLKYAYKQARNFALKLMPTYLSPQQRNLNIRTQVELPYVLHTAKQVKPGKDYFSANFFSLLLILVYNLFWYRSVTGEQQAGAALSAANLQRFSTAQVSLFFLILVLMMAERMLFRVRYFDNQSMNAQSGILGKHQLTIKVIIHVILVISVHIHLGFIIPRHNLNTMSKMQPLVISYILWVMYFISSALQIRHGYPQAPFKPPFTRDTSFFKVQAFRIYKAIPFLWEMKVITDWTVTATCLDLYQWFKLDDAFNYLYQNQQQNDDRRRREEYSQRSWVEKFFYGFCFALGLILVILAPILLFSGINPIMVKNPVLGGQLQISFELNKNGNTYRILTSQAFNIEQLQESEVDSIAQLFTPSNAKYTAADMQKMNFSPYSETEWSISPPSLIKFIEDFRNLENDESAFVEVKSSWNFKRSNPMGNENTQSETKTRISISKLQPIVQMLDDEIYTQSENSTVSTANSSDIYVENFLPKIFRLGSTQQSYPMELQPLTYISAYYSCQLTLNKIPGQRGGFYWTYSIPDSEQAGIFQTKAHPKQMLKQNAEVAPALKHPNQQYNETMLLDPNNLVIISYNEEVIGSLFGSAFQLSVVGLYATIVVAIGRFLRLIFDRISQRVIYEEMDDIEQLFEICEGIFIAQLEGDLVREKKLYDLLIKMYRSPETLIKITEPKAKNNQKRKNNTLTQHLQRENSMQQLQVLNTNQQ